MKTHKLKIAIHWFEKLLTGEKTFELRYNDRNYEPGDVLQFTILDIGSKKPERNSSEQWYVTHVLKSDCCVGLQDGYCILSLKKIS